MALSSRPALPDPNEDRARRGGAVALAQPFQLTPEELWADAPDATPHGVHLLRFAAILLKWRWAVGAAVVLALIGGVAVTLLTTPLYQATSELRIDREAPKVVDIAGGDPSAAADITNQASPPEGGRYKLSVKNLVTRSQRRRWAGGSLTPWPRPGKAMTSTYFPSPIKSLISERVLE